MGERSKLLRGKIGALSEVEEGKPSASKKPQGSTPFIYTSGQKEERTPLINLMGPKKGTSKSTEGNLEEEISKRKSRNFLKEKGDKQLMNP